jgi:aspartyl-tRNA(Asn)/glutamyl-tRNA(Gln) amidotransferase subunit A
VRRLEPSIKAWTTLDEEKALAAARQAEEEINRDGMRSPLHGVPMGIKDIFYTSGVKTTMGSPLYADFVPRYDATSVARLKRAGAVIMGKTVTTQFASLEPAETRNPWDIEHTPGGSSSGSGAAVAARMCPVALGTQTGGSVLRPAAYNGVVGLKPTHGLISSFGVFPVSWSLDTIGVLARSVEDTALALQQLVGYDPFDSESIDVSVPDYWESLHKWRNPPRIGLVRELFLERASSEVFRAVEKVTEKLALAGADVEAVPLPGSFHEALEGQTLFQGVESAVVHRATYPEQKEMYGQKVREQLDGGLNASATDYAAAKRLQPKFAGEVAASLSPFDVLLVPATDVPAPHGLDSTGDPLFQRAWTYAGVPTIALPVALSSRGLPIAIQLVGRRVDEARLLAVARWCEDVLGWDKVPETALT